MADESGSLPTPVLLVRHAVTEQTGRVLYGRTPGIPLSETGRAQASAVAARLADLPIAAVYSSPIERAHQTAQAIAAAFGHEVIRHDGLIEVDTGTFTNKSFDELAKLDEWKQIIARSSRAQLPGGESLAKMQLRAVDAIEEIARKHPGQTVVAVSHRDPILAAIAHYSGAHLDHYERVVVAPASVSALQVGVHGVMVVKCNDTGSLLDAIATASPHAHSSEDSKEERADA